MSKELTLKQATEDHQTGKSTDDKLVRENRKPEHQAFAQAETMKKHELCELEHDVLSVINTIYRKGKR